MDTAVPDMMLMQEAPTAGAELATEGLSLRRGHGAMFTPSAARTTGSQVRRLLPPLRTAIAMTWPSAGIGC